MLNRDQKEKIINELSSGLKQARSVVFSDFQGLAAKDLQELRSTLRQQRVSHKVVKITLLKRVLRQVGLDLAKFTFHVPLAVSWSLDDEVIPAKILNTFSKAHNKLKILAGILDRQFIDVQQVKALAFLPTKKELQGQIVGVIAGPLRGLVSTLSGNLRGLINVLNAVKDSKS